jgi:hypothetical protein
MMPFSAPPLAMLESGTIGMNGTSSANSDWKGALPLRPVAAMTWTAPARFDMGGQALYRLWARAGHLRGDADGRPVPRDDNREGDWFCPISTR